MFKTDGLGCTCESQVTENILASLWSLDIQGWHGEHVLEKNRPEDLDKFVHGRT